MSEQYVTRAELRTELDEIKNELLERVEKVETTLLKEFRKWASIAESRLRVNEVGISG